MRPLPQCGSASPLGPVGYFERALRSLGPSTHILGVYYWCVGMDAVTRTAALNRYEYLGSGNGTLEDTALPLATYVCFCEPACLAGFVAMLAPGSP